MQKLFSDFKGLTAAEWKAQLEKDLKGEPYDTLVWKNENGFRIQPFYNAEDLKIKYSPAFTHADWAICVKAPTANSAAINTFLLRNLMRGASSFSLVLKDVDISKALENVRLDYISSVFSGTETEAISLKKYLNTHKDYKNISASFFPKQFNTVEDLQDQLKTVMQLSEYGSIKTIAIDAYTFHNQNCLAYYEVTLVFSMFTEYLEALKGKIPSADIVVKVGVNADYFVQIAKLRAIRRLWKVFQKEYGINNQLHLIVETSLTTKSVSDVYNNLLRTTVEAMAAVAGGCNELILTNFDVFFAKENELSERMTINQQLILKEESYLDKMADISCGSYYIETLTDSLAEKALEKFKNIEEQGGFFVALKNNSISREILEQATQQAELVKNNERVLIGVNKFRNEKEIIDLGAEARELIKQQSPFNPALNYEMEHISILKNA